MTYSSTITVFLYTVGIQYTLSSMSVKYTITEYQH
jgi:hypothetical protein